MKNHPGRGDPACSAHRQEGPRQVVIEDKISQRQLYGRCCCHLEIATMQSLHKSTHTMLPFVPPTLEVYVGQPAIA
jgi:hypothetical protein